ncbi:hypothetical protein FQN54_004587 [Arachnomyces sp. PD_36]|nr:hypothetical protein FQN54_004587 [Arachnomyces sp. PD_36]
MSSIGGEAPKRATAAQMANRTIKSARGRRTRPTPSAPMPSQGASTPFGNIDPNIGPPATSQPQQSFLNNGFSFGQSQSFPPTNGASAQPAQNGTSISFGGASNPPSFNFSSAFSSGQTPNNPFSNAGTSQSGTAGGFQGFQGSLFNLGAENQNNQSVNNNATQSATTGFNNVSAAPSSNTMFGASTSQPSFGQGTTQSGAPSSGGIFSQNTSKPGPFGTGAPSTPGQTSGLFGGAGDAMQTTPDGKTRADAAPKTALFGLGAQPNSTFGSNTSSAPGASAFGNSTSQNKPFAFTSGATTEMFQPKPTAPTSGGSSLFGRVSSPAVPTQETGSSAPNGSTPAPAKDTTLLKPTGANMFNFLSKPLGTPPSPNTQPQEGIVQNMAPPGFKPLDQQSLSPKRTQTPPKTTGANMFGSLESYTPPGLPNSPFLHSPQPKRKTGANVFYISPKSEHPEQPILAPTKDNTPPKITGANIFSPKFQSADTAQSTADSAASKTTSANPFASAFKPAPASAPATDSAPTSTTAGGAFSSAFKPSAPSSTPATTGTSLFANTKPPTTSSNAFASATPAFGQAPSSQSTGGSLFAKSQGTSSAGTPAASTSLFGTSNAPSTSAASTAAAPSSGTSLFSAPPTTSTGAPKPSALFPTASSQGQPTDGSSANMFSAPASDANKKSEAAPAPSFNAQAKPTSNRENPTPNLFSAAAGGNLFAPKPTAPSPSAPDASSQNKTQAVPSLFPGSQSTSKTGSAAPPSLFAKPSTSTSSTSPVSKPTLFGETSKAPTPAAPASTPSLFHNSKPTPSAASIFAPAASSSATPPLFSPPKTSDTSKLSNNAFAPKNQLAAAAPVGQDMALTSTAANKENSLQKAKDMGVSSYGPSSVPKNLTKDQKAEFDKKFRVRSLNESFKKKVTEMDPQSGDFLSLIHYYVRVRDAIGAPTGLVRKAGMKRTSEESFDNEGEAKRVKRRTESTADDSSEQTTPKQITFQPSPASEAAGSSETPVGSPRKNSAAAATSQRPSSSSLFSSLDSGVTKRKAEDEGAGRSDSAATQIGKRARSVQEPESTTTSLFANSFAGSMSGANKFSFGGSGKPQEKQTNEVGGKAVPEIKIGSSEATQSNGDTPPSTSNGRSLFDRIQYDDQGQAKRATPTEEEQSNEKEKKALSNIFGSKFESSFNAPGTSSPKPFKNNFDFAAATRSASGSPAPGPAPSAFPPPPKTDQGQSSSSSNDKAAESAAPTKPPGNIFGSPAPSAFGSKSILGSSVGDNTWKNDSPIRFSASQPEESASGSSATAAPAPAFPALFGGKQDKTESPRPNLFGGNLGGSSQPAGFGFGGSLAKPTTQSTNLSATSSADPSRSTTPGLTSDATGADESGDGEGAQDMPQVDLTRTGAGEEDEDVLFEVRASAFRLEKGKGWEKRGEGPIRVLKHRDNGRSRIILRADPSGKVVLNVSLRKGHPYNATKDSVNVLVPEAEDKLVQWAVRVRPADGKKAESASQLASTMQENST